MTQLVYDGSFAGIMTAVFEVYERKLGTISIVKSEKNKIDIFSNRLEVFTDEQKALRVWNGLRKKISVASIHNFYACFLSEFDNIENVMLDYCRHVFASKTNVEKDYGQKSVLQITKTARKVFREKHRMEAFVRFQRLQDNVYFSMIEPDYDVLPLISSHFKDRYADQPWIIFDKSRAYGIHYNPVSSHVDEIILDDIAGPTHHVHEVLHAEEKLYQILWKDYFQHVNISSRNNLKLHIRHVPIRYWKHLTEKR